MAKRLSLRKGAEFRVVQRTGKWWSGKYLVLRALPNQLAYSRFGFLVSGRVGKAVERNRVKRRLKEIVRREPIAQGWDLVFIARADIAEASFSEIREGVRSLLRRGHVFATGAQGGRPQGEQA